MFSYPLANRIVDLMTDILINEIPLTSAYESIRKTIVSTLCRILKSKVNFPINSHKITNTQLTTTEELTLVKGVFTAFYTPFYLAHKKYVKFHSQTGPERVGRSSSLESLRLTDRYVDALLGACRNLR
jgi:hypothetical protein